MATKKSILLNSFIHLKKKKKSKPVENKQKGYMEDTYLETYNRRSLTNQPIQNSLVSVEPGVSYITLTKTLILFHCQPKKKRISQQKFVIIMIIKRNKTDIRRNLMIESLVYGSQNIKSGTRNATLAHY